MEEKVQNISKIPGATILLGGLGSVTLYFSTTLEDPFNVPKLILLILIAAWLSGHLFNSYRKFGLKLKPEDKLMVSLFSLILLFMLISSVLARAPVVTFFGDIQRRNGFITYLALILIFLYTFRFSSIRMIYKFYKTSILIGLVLSLYGVLQISGNDFVNWVNPNNSMISTLGNPNFASAMLAIVVTLCVSSYFIKLSSIFRVLSSLIIPLSIYAIIKSQSLQGLVVIGVSLGFYISFALFKKFIKSKFRLIVFVPYLFVTCIAILGMLRRGPLESLLYKDSVSVRGFYWRAAIEMLKNNFWFGVGPDRYGAFFREFREVEYTARYGFDITSSNAHNVFLQFFATNGFLVGVLYIFFLMIVIKSGIYKFLNSPDLSGKVILGLLSCWVGFQSQAMISIDQIGVSIWGWIISGLILGLSLENKNSSVNSTYTQNNPKTRNQVELNLLPTLISILLLIPTVYVSALLYASDRDTFIARSEFANPDPSLMVKKIEKVLQNPLTVPTNKVKSASYLIEKGFVTQGISELKKIHKEDVRDVDALRVLAIALNLVNNSDEEIKVRMSMAKLDRFDAPNYLRLCELYIEKKDLDQAELMKNRVLEIAPNSDLSLQVVALFGEN